MKYSFLIVILSLFFFQSQAQEKEEAKIKSCFAAYKKAILDDEGQKAVEFLSNKTIQYYAKSIDYCLHSDSTTVSELSLMDKFMVLALRHRTSAENLRNFTGKEALIYAIQEGMVGKNSVALNEIGKIKIKENTAEAQLVVRGNPTPVNFTFFKENSVWKLDLTSIFPITEKAFQQLIENSDQSENEYLLNLLLLSTQEAPSKDIWKAVGE
jgi:hypothetical protein